MSVNFTSQSNLHWVLSRYLHSVNGRTLTLPSKEYPIRYKPLETLDRQYALECEPVAITNFLQESRRTHLLTQDETFILKIPSGQFIDDASYVIAPEFNCVFQHQSLDSIYGSIEWVQKQAGLNITDNIHLKGNVLLLSSAWGGEYSHFVFNVIGKLRKFLAFPLFLDQLDYIILPENKSFIAEWVEILRIPKEKIVYVKSSSNSGYPGALISCDQLFVPASAAIGDLDTISFIRNALLRNLPKQKPDKLIYASRIKNQHLRGRHILNEDEIFNKVLEPLGFIKIIEEDLTIREKAELFNRAKFVLAPMGSGSVTHLSFMQPGTTALEIMGSHWVDYINDDILKNIGVNYFYHITSETEGSNMYLDKIKLQRMMTQLRHLL